MPTSRQDPAASRAEAPFALNTVHGRISVNPRGFGFLNFQLDGREASAFVVPPDLNSFLEGDRVSATLTASSDGRYTASALKLLERTRHELFGTVTFHARRPYLRVDRTVSNTDWPLEGEDFREGDALVGELRDGRLYPLRPLDPEDDLALERCLVRHHVRSEFSPEAQAQVAPPLDFTARRDLRQIPTVTIDAPSTTDIDDALAALPADPDGALRVLVSIADVDAAVPAGSPLDVEARLRGTSVYLAGRVVPMIPEQLSSGAVSLLPDTDRLTLTAELRIDPEGNLTSVDVYESVIRSHARLSYEAVSDFLLGIDAAAVPVGVQTTLSWLRTASARLSAVRAARGGVELGREEAYVSFDPATREPIAVQARRSTMAHRMVERLMVAANEAIAGWLVERGQPGLFRVHDQPTSDQIAKLAVSAHNFGIEAGFGPRLTPRGLAAFEAQFRDTPVEPAMRTVLGWALGVARYTVHPGLHFGLGAPLYLHFTSPIRRYADLTVHRLIKGYLHGDRSQRVGDPALEELAVQLNQVTLRASKAENERHRMLVARYFAGRIGDQGHGNIVAVKPFGLVVQMVGTAATGTIALDALPDGPYRVDLDAHALIGRTQRFAVGDPIEVQISGTNEELGRVELELIFRNSSET
jgi:ribonuclease R